jgi:type IV pilus assembly protein PilQ
MLIAPFEDLVKREEQELNSKEKIKTILPLNHATIQIKYAKAKVMSEILKNFLSERGTIVFDERTNKLMVADTDERLMDVKKRVETLDIPIRQVVIEARIVFAKKNAQEELGVQWSGGVQKTGKNSLGMIGGNQQGLSDIVDNANQQRAGTGGTINPPNSSLVGLPVAGATSGIALGFLNKSLSLDVALSALEKSGDIEIVARPKIITADQKTATIESGKEYPYLELSDNGNSGVQFKQIVLSLAVTPQITPNDKILLDLKIVQDSVAELTNSGPAIDSTKMETQVLSNNGETIVLGGVFKSDIVKETEKTPILGDIPYLGRLFKKTVDREEKSELLLFITPRLVESEILPSE